MTSSQVTKSLTSMTLDRIYLQSCARYHSVCLLMPIDWYATSPTWVIHQVRSFGLTSGLTFRGQNAYISMRLRARNTIMLNIFLYISEFKRYLQKNVYITKNRILSSTCQEKVKMWPKAVKSDVVGFRPQGRIQDFHWGGAAGPWGRPFGYWRGAFAINSGNALQKMWNVRIGIATSFRPVREQKVTIISVDSAASTVWNLVIKLSTDYEKHW